ncbi:MAG: hypothetical protein KC777_17930 [Cyanobacteria bacterium HKST-UBA02]|nr:hypothetical protein [Cyanobacteria bacterium HKST-UBA02]
MFYRKANLVAVRTLGLAIVLILNSGFTFGRAKLHNSVATFSEAATVSIASVREFYSGINDFHRWAYLERAKISIGKNAELGVVRKNGAPTGLERMIPDEYIAPRLMVLDALAKYSSNLAKLAGSDAPEQAAQAIQESGQHIYAISKQIDALSKGPSSSTLDIEKYTKPISKLAAILTREGMDWKRNRDLKKNIQDAAPFVKDACELLAKDTDLLLPSTYNTKLNEVLTGYITYYNNYLLTKGDPERDLASYRLNMLADIRSLQERRLALMQTSPKAAIEKLASVHLKLVEVVQKRGKKPNLDEVVSDIDAFTELAKEVSEAIFNLRDAFTSQS